MVTEEILFIITEAWKMSTQINKIHFIIVYLLLHLCSMFATGETFKSYILPLPLLHHFLEYKIKFFWHDQPACKLSKRLMAYKLNSCEAEVKVKGSRSNDS